MKDKKFYIGYTSDIKRRLEEHRRGETKSTSCRRPFKLIFCEFYFSKKDAKRRERYLKTTDGKRMLRLILRNSLRKINELTN